MAPMWQLVLELVISAITLAVTAVYVLLQYREYHEARHEILQKCARAVVCEAFQRFMQPTIALRFECLTQAMMADDRMTGPSLLGGNNRCAVASAVATFCHLSRTLQMTPQDVREMIAVAEVIWEDEGYRPRCPAHLRHELLRFAAHRLHGEHVDLLIQNASSFVQAVRQRSCCVADLQLVGPDPT